MCSGAAPAVCFAGCLGGLDARETGYELSQPKFELSSLLIALTDGDSGLMGLPIKEASVASNLVLVNMGKLFFFVEDKYSRPSHVNSLKSHADLPNHFRVYWG